GALADRDAGAVAAGAWGGPGPGGGGLVLVDRPRRPAVVAHPSQGVDPPLVRGQPCPVPRRAGAGAEAVGGQRVRDILRRRDVYRPVPAVRREVLTARPAVTTDRPPLVLVPGFGGGAWVYAEHWLDHAAERGFAAHAVSLRGQDRKSTRLN